jgi:hypothetical protein
MAIDLEHGVTNGVGADLTLAGGIGETLAGFIAPGQLVGDKQSCITVLNARHDTCEVLSGVEVGSWLCVQTDAGHIAALHVLALPTVGDPNLVFSYTVWR